MLPKSCVDPSYNFDNSDEMTILKAYGNLPIKSELNSVWLRSLKTKTDKLKNLLGYKSSNHHNMNRIHDEPFK